MTGDNIKQKLSELNLLDDTQLYNWYLPLLHAGAAIKHSPQLLDKYRRFADGLKHSPEFTREMIRDKNWRPTLLGLTVAILLRASELQEDMIWRLAHGNWVAPQLAAAIALVDAGKGSAKVGKILQNASPDSEPKTIMSAYSALRFLKSALAEEFQTTELFDVLKEKDSWDGSIGIAVEHWEFWKQIEPNK